MATIVHRRSVDIAPAEPRGPGASLSSLTWVGWLFLAAAAGRLAVGMGPVREMGDVATWDWPGVLGLAASSLADAAVMALPAALEWGTPGARYRTPWLWRGAVLLAAVAVAGEAIGAVDGRFVEISDLGVLEVEPVYFVIRLLRLGLGLLGIAGAWSLSDGLTDAGAQLRRRVVAGAAVGGALLAAWFAPLFLVTGDYGIVGGVAGRLAVVAGSALGVVDGALWMVIAARLIAGWRARLRPARAWGIAALAGALYVAAPVLFVVLGTLPIVDLSGGWWILSAMHIGQSILLAAALAAGLGRGRVRREAPPRRWRRFELGSA